MSTSVEMEPDERDEFLGTGGTGVLSLSSPEGESPYSIPVSYGYDQTEQVFYFRLATGPDSEKGDLLDRPVTFVTHGETEEGWRSVVANGRFEETAEKSISAETIEGLERVYIPLVDIFGRPPRDISFTFVRLVPEELTGRKESRTAI